MNIIYAVFKLFLGMHYISFWYGADAIFYLILSVIRFSLLHYMRKDEKNSDSEYRLYRFCGCLLIAMNIALIGVVYQIVDHDIGYQYPGLLIYAVATFAFLCLTIAIINVVKYRKLNNPVLSAIKAISLTKALVAIFALQTALLNSFGNEDGEFFMRLLNSLTGGFVCLSIFAIAVLMIVRAKKKKKKPQY
jgi:hypothetical protein